MTLILSLSKDEGAARSWALDLYGFSLNTVPKL
jgi:hypothetical protein